MLFLARGLVAGAHGLRMLLAAIADADTTQGDPAKIPFVFGILKMCLWLRRIVIGSQTQIFCRQIGVDNFSGIHFPIRIPDRFEFAEGLHQFFTEHFRQKLRFGLTVTMFAR